MHKEPSWRARAMYIVFAFALVFGMSAVIMPSQTAPVEASPDPTNYVLYTGTLGSADWSAVQEKYGEASVKLVHNAVGAGSVYLQFVPATGTTFAAFQAAITATTPKYSFWYNRPLLAAVPNGPQFELRFEDPASTGWLEVTAVGLQNVPGDGAWHEETLAGATLSGYGGNTPDGSSVFGWGPLTALSGIETAVNTAWNTAEAGKSTSAYLLERVRVELWEAGPDATSDVCYVDDITIQGVANEVEPEILSLTPSIALDVKGSEQCFEAEVNYTPTTKLQWTILPGVQLSAEDINTVSGGTATDLTICIQSAKPGDTHIRLDILVDGELIGNYLTAEKKWGVIEETELDMDPLTAGIQT
ncbi:MAG: hypothetical protein KAH98_03205, partial [Dehalococcoidia bacterium]|nr:hypothetical protein [Dehalococcoidia bacterium]